jgi:hypothetical protein
MDINQLKTPPYGSVNRLKYVFDLFSTHSFPQVTSSLLKGRGFSGSDAFQTISALKFLGVVDAEGNKTDTMTKLQLRGEERTQAIAQIVKNAYLKLFETVTDPNKLSRDDLHNDFISIYGLSGRLASTAVPNFLWLCKEGGLEVTESSELKERKPRSKALILSQKTKDKDIEGANSEVQHVISGEIEGITSKNDLIKFELPLGGNDKAIIFTPSEMTADHLKKIRGYIDYLATLVKAETKVEEKIEE